VKIDRDPLLDRIKPGVLRMREAEAWLAEYRRNGHQVLVDWNAPHLRVVNQAGKPLEHPAGLLPELCWLLRKLEPYKPPVPPPPHVLRAPGLRWADGSGPGGVG